MSIWKFRKETKTQVYNKLRMCTTLCWRICKLLSPSSCIKYDYTQLPMGKRRETILKKVQRKTGLDLTWELRPLVSQKSSCGNPRNNEYWNLSHGERKSAPYLIVSAVRLGDYSQRRYSFKILNENVTKRLGYFKLSNPPQGQRSTHIHMGTDSSKPVNATASASITPRNLAGRKRQRFNHQLHTTTWNSLLEHQTADPALEPSSSSSGILTVATNPKEGSSSYVGIRNDKSTVVGSKRPYIQTPSTSDERNNLLMALVEAAKHRRSNVPE